MQLSLLIKFWNDEEAQTTTEYVLILLLVITIISKFKSGFVDFLKGLIGTLEEKAGKITDDEDI